MCVEYSEHFPAYIDAAVIVIYFLKLPRGADVQSYFKTSDLVPSCYILEEAEAQSKLSDLLWSQN